MVLLVEQLDLFIGQLQPMFALDALIFCGICCTKCNEVEVENRETEITILVYMKVY